MTPSCQSYIRNLYKLDWTDSITVTRLKRYADTVPEYHPFFYHALDCVQRGVQIEFPAAMLETQTPTNIHTTIMKDLLDLLHARFLQPFGEIVDKFVGAVDRLAKLNIGTGYAPEALPPTSEPPPFRSGVVHVVEDTPPAEKPKGRGRPPKAVAEPQPEPEPPAPEFTFADDDDVTAEDLAAMLPTVPPENRASFKPWLKEKTGLDSYKDATTREQRLIIRQGFLDRGAKLPQPAVDEWG